MAQTLPTSEVLNLAADLIERDGWWQGGYAPDQSANGASMDGLPVCAMGALYRAAGTPLAWSADMGCWVGVYGGHVVGEPALANYLGGRDVRDIARWNDTKGRTAAEVIEVLRAAAAIEASREDAALLAEIGRA